MPLHVLCLARVDLLLTPRGFWLYIWRTPILSAMWRSIYPERRSLNSSTTFPPWYRIQPLDVLGYIIRLGIG